MSQVVILSSGPVAGSMAEISEQGMSPITSSGNALAVGRIKLTADLYAAFVADEGDAKRVAVVFNAAATEGYTTSDLSDNLKAACKMADEADIRAGWVAPEGAKGQEKYGPRRSSMNARSSEIRQMFGAISQGADIKADMGYSKVLKSARLFLKERGVQWDGSKSPTKEEKAAAASVALVSEVQEDWMKKHPQQAGESIRDYYARMGEACEILAAEAQMLKDKEALTKVAKALVDKHGVSFCGDLAELLAEMYNAHIEAQATLEGKGPEIVM